MKQSLLFLFVFGILQTGLAQITGMSPNKGNRGQTLPIIISGSNTNWHDQGSGTILYIHQGSHMLGMGTIKQGSITGQGSNTIFKNASIPHPDTIKVDFTVPLNAPLGFYTLNAHTSSSINVKPNAFEVLPGTTTNVTLKTGGGKPGETLNEEITWIGLDMTGLSIDKMWLSKNGNTIVSLTNPTITFKDTKTSVDIEIPVSAEQGYWNVNILTSNGQIFESPGAFLIDAIFDIDDYELEEPFVRVYPNPASNRLHLNFEFDNTKQTRIKVIDLNGRVAYSSVQEANKKKAVLDISSLKNGVYYVQIMEDNRVLTTIKWIKI